MQANPTAQKNLLFTRPRAAQILAKHGIQHQGITYVNVTATNVIIGYVALRRLLGTTATFSEFLALATAERKQRASDEGYVATRQKPGEYAVCKPHGNGYHIVRVGTTGMTCTCHDHGKLEAVCKSIPHLWKEVCKEVAPPCKHVYTVLGTLGFGSMRDYLKSWQHPDGANAKLSAVINRRSTAIAPENDFPAHEVDPLLEADFWA